LNQIIQSQPELSEWSNRVYVQSILDDRIVLQVSIPFAAMGQEGARFAGKYLVGNLHLIAGMHEGDVRVHAIDFERDGKSAPLIDAPMSQMLDLKKRREHDPELDAMLSRVKALELQDGKIRLIVGPKP
jgi:hypothetical protein